MLDSRRFLVSEQSGSYRKTLLAVCDKMNGKLETFWENMEMSGMTLRIEWKCSRVLAGLPSG